MIIAVDFDGTIVEHRYPRIGGELPSPAYLGVKHNGNRFDCPYCY